MKCTWARWRTLGSVEAKRKSRTCIAIRGHGSRARRRPPMTEQLVSIHVPRDNQGETATTIRMRLLPGVAGRSEGVARATADHPRRRIFSVGYCCGKDARWAVVSGPAKGLVHLRIEGISFAGPSHQRPPDEALHGTSNDTRRDGCGREIRLQPGERLSD